ncbi:MAG TPA: hypothetical protein VKR23_09845 [Gaiellaceae bacterium]|nr:hypothetical protein [Gaiellaceae bacterium]
MTVKTDPLAIDAGTVTVSEDARALVLASAGLAMARRAIVGTKAHKTVRRREKRDVTTMPLVDTVRRVASRHSTSTTALETRRRRRSGMSPERVGLKRSREAGVQLEARSSSN